VAAEDSKVVALVRVALLVVHLQVERAQAAVLLVPTKKFQQTLVILLRNDLKRGTSKF
jgi:hypothetical protein